MAVLSRVLLASNRILFNKNGLLGKLLPKNKNCVFPNQSGIVRRMSDHHVMEIDISRWQWHKTKDWMHFYFLVGAIPALLVVTYCNVFIGPATLEPIPEGYIPKQWEYHKHPITRFLSKHWSVTVQMEYEKFLHRVDQQQKKKMIRDLRQRVRDMMTEHSDYKYLNYKRGTAKYIIDVRKRMDAGEYNA